MHRFKRIFFLFLLIICEYVLITLIFDDNLSEERTIINEEPVAVLGITYCCEEVVEEPEHITLVVDVTAYTAGYKCTGKTPDHPLYGVTCSGEYVQEGITIAAPKEFPFGTEIDIPNYGRGIVMDRGGAVKWREDLQRYILDVYIEDYDEAVEWGRRTEEVNVFTENLSEEEVAVIKREN